MDHTTCACKQTVNMCFFFIRELSKVSRAWKSSSRLSQQQFNKCPFRSPLDRPFAARTMCTPIDFSTNIVLYVWQKTQISRSLKNCVAHNRKREEVETKMTLPNFIFSLSLSLSPNSIQIHSLLRHWYCGAMRNRGKKKRHASNMYSLAFTRRSYAARSFYPSDQLLFFCVCSRVCRIEYFGELPSIIANGCQQKKNGIVAWMNSIESHRRRHWCTTIGTPTVYSYCV